MREEDYIWNSCKADEYLKIFIVNSVVTCD